MSGICHLHIWVQKSGNPSYHPSSWRVQKSLGHQWLRKSKKLGVIWVFLTIHCWSRSFCSRPSQSVQLWAQPLRLGCRWGRSRDYDADWMGIGIALGLWVKMFGALFFHGSHGSHDFRKRLTFHHWNHPHQKPPSVPGGSWLFATEKFATPRPLPRSSQPPLDTSLHHSLAPGVISKGPVEP